MGNKALSFLTAGGIDQGALNLQYRGGKICADLNGLSVSALVCLGAPEIARLTGQVKKELQAIDAKLVEARECAWRLAGDKKKCRSYAEKIPLPAVKSGKEITVEPTFVRTLLDDLKTDCGAFDAIAAELDKAGKEIAAIRPEDQEMDTIEEIRKIAGLPEGPIAFAVRKARDTAAGNIAKSVKSAHKITFAMAMLSQAVKKVLERFEKAEEKGRMALFDERLQKSREITTEKQAREDGGRTVKELEQLQAEYVALYGVESPEIAAEIARIKHLHTTEAIRLKPGMTEAEWNQHQYEVDGRKGTCCATAYAIGLSIIDGKSHDPKQYHYGKNGGRNHWDDGGVKKFKSKFTYAEIYEELKKSKPVLFEYEYTYYDKKKKEHKTTTHWVLINGVREGADTSALKPSDFTAIDPGYGKEYKLSTILGRHPDNRILGIKKYK